MKSELTFSRPTEGQYIRLKEQDNDGAQPMYIELPEDGSEITAQEAYDAYTTGYDTIRSDDDDDRKGLEYIVEITLCEIDADGDESELDDWGTWKFYADGEGGVIDEEEWASAQEESSDEN
jgi:hypothetical protein